MKNQNNRNKVDPYDGMNDILCELKRIPRAGTDNDFTERLHIEIARIDTLAETKTAGLLEYIKKFFTNWYVLASVSMAAAVLLVYFIMPKEKEQLISNKDNNPVTKQDSSSKNTIPDSGALKSRNPLALNKQVDSVPDARIRVKKSIAKRTILNKELVGDMKLQVNPQQLSRLRDNILANTAKETDEFRNKIRNFKPDWLKDLREKILNQN